MSVATNPRNQNRLNIPSVERWSMLLLDEVPVPIVVCRPNRTIFYVNRAATTLWHTEVANLLGVDIAQALHPQDRHKLQDIELNQLEMLHTPIQLNALRILCPNSTYSRFHVTIGTLQFEHHSLMYFLLKPVTLIELEKQVSESVEPPPTTNTPQLAILVDRTGIIRQITPGLLEIVGQQTNWEGRSLDELLEAPQLITRYSHFQPSLDMLTTPIAGSLRLPGYHALAVNISLRPSPPAGWYLLAIEFQRPLDFLWAQVLHKYSLTQHEAELVMKLCRGRSSHQLAMQLNIAPATVRTHLRNIFTKSAVKSRVELLSRIFTQFLDRLNTPTNSTSMLMAAQRHSTTADPDFTTASAVH
ncbi:MAG: hypothetical protein HJJLKODD_00223 [Phycisphaerae bacterium]|nr:hypothetical protein [Phycisphaerae bacterium]